MAYRSMKGIDERNRRIFMAGLTFTELVGFRTPREFCAHTTLMIADVDTNEMLFFSNTIDRDEKNALEGNLGTLTDYFASSIPAYLHPDYQERAFAFFANEHLRDSFERGRFSESLEYPCLLVNETMWIRACYYLEQDDDTGHVLATIVLIDVTQLHEADEV